MTSSFILKNLKNNWDYDNSQEAPLGGLENQYLRLQGECHPDFKAYPIGNKQGAKICVRRKNPGQECLMNKSVQNIVNSQGYHRGCLNLYDVHQKVPTQQVNPQYYADRRMPYESDLIRRDYWHLPIKFEGTGIHPLHVPHELDDASQPYLESPNSFTPAEDKQTGMRIAKSRNDTLPPPKYDITRLHQPYILWKSEHEYQRYPQDKLDQKYFDRII